MANTFTSLSAAETAALEAHVAECRDCAAECSAMRQVAEFRAAVPAMPSSLHERAWQLQALRDSKPRSARRRRPVIVGSLFLLAAAATWFTPVPDARPADR